MHASIHRIHSTPRHLVQHTPIHRNHLAVHVHVPAQKDDRHRHLLVAPGPLRRHVALLLDLLVRQLALVALLIPRLGRHLAGEIARRDAVDAHVGLLEFCGHKLGEVDGSAFGSVVGEVTLRVAHDAAHAADDDDGGGTVRMVGLQRVGRRGGSLGGLQKRKEGDGGEVDRGDVCVKHGRPFRGRFGGPEGRREFGGVGRFRDPFGAGDASVGYFGKVSIRTKKELREGARVKGRGSSLSRFMYFSFAEISSTSFSRSALEVTSQGPALSCCISVSSIKGFTKQ